MPFVWLLEGLSVLADPRLLLAGLWSGLGLVLVDQTSRLPHFDRTRTLTAGSLAVAVLFTGTLLTATDLPGTSSPSPPTSSRRSSPQRPLDWCSIASSRCCTGAESDSRVVSPSAWRRPWGSGRRFRSATRSSRC
ncbi:hypothetical protein ACFQH8_05085 [Halomicroarcula sp. GCM10025710]